MADVIIGPWDLAIGGIIKERRPLQVEPIPLEQLSGGPIGDVRCAPAPVVIAILDGPSRGVPFGQHSVGAVRVGVKPVTATVAIEDQAPAVPHAVGRCAVDRAGHHPVKRIVFEGLGPAVLGHADQPVLRIVAVTRSIKTGRHVPVIVVVRIP